jgi:hypothetical protein
MEAGDVAGSRVDFDHAREIASELHLPLLDWQVLIDQSSHAATAGDFAAAEAIADDALALANRAGLAIGLGVYGGQLNNIRSAQGRSAEIVEFFVEAADAMPQIEPLRAGAIPLLLDVGDTDAARARYDQERAAGFAFARSIGWYNSMESLSDACVDFGDRDSALLLLEQLRPFTDRFLASHAVASRPVARFAGRLAGLLGLDDEAETDFSTAVTLCDRLDGAPYWKARTLIDRAGWLLGRQRSGDAARAAQDLEDALALAQPIGAAHIPALVGRLRANG